MKNKHQDSLNSKEDVVLIDQYTSKQAEEDGLLVDLTKIQPKWREGLFNYVTTNLLNEGYVQKDKINIASVIDLLNQAMKIIKNKSNDFKKYDTFFCGIIELPNGAKQEIFIEKNETGKFTLMLPEDR